MPRVRRADLDRLSNEEIDAFAKAHNVAIVRSEAEYRQAEHTRRYGREVWKGMLWILLALCLGELLLQQRFAGIRRRA